MSDIHRLPLLGRDMPEYTVRQLPVAVRPRVFARRAVTGQLFWYWSRPFDGNLTAVRGPFWTTDDAHNDIARHFDARKN